MSTHSEKTVKDFRSLIAWQKAHALLMETYRVTALFPKQEQYTLTSQIRRSGLSIPSNLAEACGWFSRGDYRRFIDHAAGSSKEFEYQLWASRELGYLEHNDWERLQADVDHLQRLLRGLYNSHR